MTESTKNQNPENDALFQSHLRALEIIHLKHDPIEAELFEITKQQVPLEDFTEDEIKVFNELCLMADQTGHPVTVHRMKVTLKVAMVRVGDPVRMVAFYPVGDKNKGGVTWYVK
ncbi:MAG: hypothetical protein IBX56_14310 [Methylomicrobium sp.]|nr:hypothetical protein [Methylomicrobium sp.]